LTNVDGAGAARAEHPVFAPAASRHVAVFTPSVEACGIEDANQMHV